ncbi:MAG: hypothetical protein ABJ327_20350 [Litoreibacter sp.]
MNPETVTKYFTRANGDYTCARWGRPIAPIVFGVEDETISVFKGALEAMCLMTGHQLTETDPELGANLMVFFMRDWQELLDTPNLDRLIPELPELVERLRSADANQYRIFRFDRDNAIKASFVFLRMDEAMSEIPADTLCLGQVVQSFALWSEAAFLETSPLALIDGQIAVLKPDVAAVLRAVYDPTMPVSAQDPSHAHRLAARASLINASG